LTVQLLLLLPSRLTKALGPRDHLVTRLICIHTTLRPADSLRCLRQLSSMGFRASVSLLSAIQATRLRSFASVGFCPLNAPAFAGRAGPTKNRHGWGDSNLYLRRTGSGLRLSIEHRAAPGRDGVALELAELDTGPALRLIDSPDADDALPTSTDAHGRILDALAALADPVSASDLRAGCRMRAETFWRALRQLVDAGRVARTDADLYQLTG
jgi:hypothetical protein